MGFYERIADFKKGIESCEQNPEDVFAIRIGGDTDKNVIIHIYNPALILEVCEDKSLIIRLPHEMVHPLAVDMMKAANLIREGKLDVFQKDTSFDA